MVQMALDVVQAHLGTHQEFGPGAVRDGRAVARGGGAAVPAVAAVAVGAVAPVGGGGLEGDGDALHGGEGQLAKVADQEADAERVALEKVNCYPVIYNVASVLYV